jgi:asparagine synthase (glutamine-hydrolysing)
VRGLFTPAQVDDLLQFQACTSDGADAAGMRAWSHAVDAELCRARQYDPVGEVSWLELSMYMRSTLLRDADAMSMAHSLEVRVPLVDHLLVEQILPVGARSRLEGRQPKPLLVRAVGDLLPAPIVSRAKRTFTFPFERWLREGLGEAAAEALQSPSDALACWLEPSAVKQVWQDFERGQTNWARPWALYVLDAWIRENV